MLRVLAEAELTLQKAPTQDEYERGVCHSGTVVRLRFDCIGTRLDEVYRDEFRGDGRPISCCPC
ncbi:hypothetical protein GCM10009067_41480 [Haloarcula sebkhae]|uniref:Uncharacterized protein n=1 Tax=Haloarcula sebkhae TaxID=932660 RepID=A0A830F531_9EURY|nr:hypothetical protein GCM10009067_41480 [Haloarcula sebkhae]